MKFFSLVASLAVVSSIQVNRVSNRVLNRGFDKLDANDNGLIEPTELLTGLEQVAAARNHTLTPEEIEWVKKTAEKVDTDGSISFNK